VILLLAAAACDEAPAAVVGDHPPPDAPLTAPTQLCRKSAPQDHCRDADDVEALLGRPDLEILGAARAPAGIQGVRVLTLRAGGPVPVVFRAKWRATSTATRRNSPRRELAAYAVQKVFLEPDEYVVPPTARHCFPLEASRAVVDRRARATSSDPPCVEGVLSYWLEDVQSLNSATRAGWFHGADGHALDRALFDGNATYRDSIAMVNLFTYVIGHADSHAANFVITVDREHPLVYSVDNSLSLGMARNRHLAARHDWSRLQVPALPRAVTDRLRNARGRLDEVDGLTPDEIAGVRERIDALLRRLDDHQVPLY
jgi:hypothetical protein